MDYALERTTAPIAADDDGLADGLVPAGLELELAELDACVAGCDGLAESATLAGRHVCVGQATMGLRVTRLLALSVWRIRTTASVATSTVGTMTAQM